MSESRDRLLRGCRLWSFWLRFDLVQRRPVLGPDHTAMKLLGPFIKEAKQKIKYKKIPVGAAFETCMMPRYVFAYKSLHEHHMSLHLHENTKKCYSLFTTIFLNTLSFFEFKFHLEIFLLPNRLQPPFLHFRVVHEADFKVYIEWKKSCDGPILKHYLVRQVGKRLS